MVLKRIRLVRLLQTLFEILSTQPGTKSSCDSKADELDAL